MKNFFKKTVLLPGLAIILAACSSLPSTTVNQSAETAAPAAQAPAATPVSESRPQFDLVSAPELTQVEMLDEHNGWAQAEGLVLRTEDGGESWFDVTPQGMPNDPAYAKSCFLDEKTGWILLEDMDKPNYGTIYRTTDGGVTWLWKNTPFGRSEIGFFDAEHGYALTDLGAAAGSMGVAIWQTENGGKDFDRVFLHEPGFDDSLPFSGTKNGITFISPQKGWVAGSVPEDGTIWLYRTVDGGFSWEAQELPMPLGYENYQASADAPLFFDNGLGVLPVHLLGEERATVFYRSTDSGETWTATLPAPMRGQYALASANEIFLWDGSARFFSSADGGETWDFNATNWQPTDSLRKLDFVSASLGWALADGELRRTQDGGLTWEKPGE